MSIAWTARLIIAGDIAKEAAGTLPQRLAADDLTVLEASHMYFETERNAQAMDSLVDMMAEEDVDDALLEAAEALQDIWDSLTIAAVNRMRELQGLPPIEIAVSDEDDEDGDE